MGKPTTNTSPTAIFRSKFNQRFDKYIHEDIARRKESEKKRKDEILKRMYRMSIKKNGDLVNIGTHNNNREKSTLIA